MAKLPSYFSKLTRDLDYAVMAANLASQEDKTNFDAGDPALNWGTGKIPTDRITILAGVPGACKSFLMYYWIGQLMKANPEAGAVIFDIEYYLHNKPDRVRRLAQFGIDLNRLLIISSNEPDKVFAKLSMLEEGVKESPLSLCAIGVDSLGGATAAYDEKKIKEGEIEQAGNKFGGMAKVMGPLVKAMTRISAENKVAVFLIQHAIQDMASDPSGPKKWIVTGGQKLKHQADLMLLMESVERKDAGLTADNNTIENSDKDAVKIGKTIRTRVLKSRNTVEGRVVEFQVNMETCQIVNKNRSLFNLAKKLGVVYHPTGDSGKPSLHWWAYKDDKGAEHKFHGQEKTEDSLVPDTPSYLAVERQCMTASMKLSENETVNIDLED
jgi:RecA/RadA recombinase